MKNKRGMSAVVTTLIIILLVIVALGIIWVVVRNVLQSGTEEIEWANECRLVELEAVSISVFGNGSDEYNVTLSRTGSGEDTLGGVKLVFSDGTDYSNVTEFDIAIGKLETKTRGTGATGVANATELQITPYFVDDLGEEHICQTKTVEF